MAVLVTGVGYLGAALAARLLRAGERVVGFDNGWATDRRAVAGLAALGDFVLVPGSVAVRRDVARAFARGPFETVYHLAAQASAPAALRRPRYTETTNLTGLRVVLDAAARHGVPRVVYGSSIRIYGHALPARVDETTPYGPQSDLVHLSQLYGEKLLELYARRRALTAVAVRLAVVYGVGPVAKTDYAYLTVPNKFCLQAVRGEPLVVYPGAATPTAFVHLDDACAALQAAATVAWPAGFHAANAAGEVCTVPDVAALVARAAIGPPGPPGAIGPPGPPILGGVGPNAAPSPDMVPSDSSTRKGLAERSAVSPPGWGGVGGADRARGARGQGPARGTGVGGRGARLEGGAAVTIGSRLSAEGWRATRTLAESVGEIIDYYRAREAP